MHIIRSCRNNDTQKLVDREFCKKFAAIEKVARMRLDRLNAAASRIDLSAIPGHRLGQLKVTGKAATASGLTTNSESVSNGRTETPGTLKWWTTTEETKCEARN